LKDILHIESLKLIFLRENPDVGVYELNPNIDFDGFLSKVKSLIESHLKDIKV
jgi:hypothetical protein